MSRCLSWSQIESIATGEESPSGEVRAHLESCAGCRRRLAGFSAVLAAARTLPVEQAPGLADEIGRAVATAERVRPLGCRATCRLLEAYRDGELAERLVARLEVHLFTCPRCYRAYRELLDLREVALTVQPEAPPPGLRERIHASVAAEAARSRRVSRPVFARRRAWAAAAAAVVLLLGILAASLMQSGSGEPAGPSPERVAVVAPSAGAPSVPAPAVRPGAESESGARDALAAAAGSPTRERPSPARALSVRRQAPASVEAKREAAPATRESSASPVMVAARRQPQPEGVSRPAAPVPAVGARPGHAEALDLPGERVAVVLPGPAPAPVPAVSPTRAAPAAPMEGPGARPPTDVAPPGPTTPPAPPEAPAPRPVRLAAAGTEGAPHWLPVRSAEPERVVVAPESGPAQLADAARRLNAEIEQDERWARDGWIPIK